MDQSRAFRDALAQYPTGVALVTIAGPDGPRAMTINSFASVSLEPALVLWSLARDSERWPAFRDAARFAINVLGDDQAALAGACARQGSLERAAARWRTVDGVAVIERAPAWFVCARREVVAGGDHDIILGEVTDFGSDPARPALVFHGSQYGSTAKD